MIGAPADDDQGFNSGSAYVFNTASGAPTAKLTAADGTNNDYFGSSVAISGATAVVGAMLDDDQGSSSGSVYVFDAVSGAQSLKLTANDGAANDRFGHSVGISGNTIIVGAQFDDDRGSNSGSAYVFDATSGAELAKLTASDGVARDQFGYSVGISGGTAIVGALLDDDAGESSGSAYVFDVASGAQTAKLTAADAESNDQFGYAVAVSGNTAIVGAPVDDQVDTDNGAAYLFDAVSGAQIAKLLAPDGTYDDQFGASVAISGDTAIVGALYEDGGGAAYLFNTLSGAFLGKLTASNLAGDDNFGASVAISGDTAVVGALYGDGAVTNSGAAYAYSTSSPVAVPLPASAWTLLSALAGTVALGGGRGRSARISLRRRACL